MTPSIDPIRLHELRQLAFGELDEGAEAAVRGRLAEDPKAQARFEALVAERDAFAQREDSVGFSVRVVERLDARSRRPIGGRWFGVAATVAAGAALTVLSIDGPAPPSGHRSKGRLVGEDPRRAACKGVCRHPVLEMFVKDRHGIRRGQDGVKLAPGDWVQFRYRADGHRHVFIASVDDDRVIAPLYPDHPGKSVTVLPDGLHVLAGSVILDDAVGPERIFAFFSTQPLQYDQVSRFLATVDDPVQTSSVVVDADVDQVSILIYKEAP